MKTTCYPLLATFLLLPALASAQSAVKVPVLTPEERAYLNEEDELLRNLRLAELKAKIAEAEKKSAGVSGMELPAGLQLPPAIASGIPMDPPSMVAGAAPATAVAPAPAQKASDFPYKVISVWGTDPLRADMVSSDGGTFRVTVMEGHALPGGWKVDQVGKTGVVMTKGKAKKILMVGG